MQSGTVSWGGSVLGQHDKDGGSGIWRGACDQPTDHAGTAPKATESM